MTPAVFLDRDGVLCANRPDYVKSWNEFEWMAGAADACVALSRNGVRLFVITNQSAVGRGIIPLAHVEAINALMVRSLERIGTHIDGVYVCPHAPQDRCVCRKPEPGLLLQAAAEHEIDLSRSWFVGDAASDITAAYRAGCGSILVLTGRGRAQLADASVWNGARPAYVARDIGDATCWLLGQLSEVSTQ